MPSRLCPLADTTSQWWDAAYQGGAIEGNVVVLHSTEGPSWPAYGRGAVAPHLTYFWRPAMTMRQKLRQHFSLLRSARALIDASGGVATNRGNALQIELVGTCDPQAYRKWKPTHPDVVLWTDPPEEALSDLAQIVRWLDADLPRLNPSQRTPRGWKPYRLANGSTAGGSYGISNGVRLTFAEWDRFYGICGHQHVPENDHGDPGNFPIERLLSKVLTTGGGSGSKPVPPTTTPSPEEDDMPSPRDLWAEPISRWPVPGDKDPGTEPAASVLARIQRAGEMDYRSGQDALGRLARLEALVTALADKLLDPAEIQAAAEAGAKAAIDAKITSATTTLQVTPADGA